MSDTPRADFEKALFACVEYRSKLDELERENTALQNEVDELKRLNELTKVLTKDLQDTRRENTAMKELINNPNAMHTHYLRECNGWEVWHGDRVRKMESDIVELELKLAALGEIAVANWDDPTVGEVDKHVKSVMYKDMLHTLFVKNPKRIKELQDEIVEANGLLDMRMKEIAKLKQTLIEVTTELTAIKCNKVS